MPPRNILVPVDGSMHAQNAVAYADDLADKCGSNLCLLHVMKSAGSSNVPEGLRELAKRENIDLTEHDVLRAGAEGILERATAKVTMCERGRVTSEIRIGDATDEIVQFVRDHGIDLIVMGSRGMSDLKGMLLGSVSHKVVQLADCPCLLVRESAAGS